MGRFTQERFVRKTIRGRVFLDANFVGNRWIISLIHIYRQSIEFAPPHPARVELIVSAAFTGFDRVSLSLSVWMCVLWAFSQQRLNNFKIITAYLFCRFCAMTGKSYTRYTINVGLCKN